MQVDILLNSFLWSPEIRAGLDAFMQSALLGEKIHAHDVLSLIFNRQSINYVRQSSRFQISLAGLGSLEPLHAVESKNISKDATIMLTHIRKSKEESAADVSSRVSDSDSDSDWASGKKKKGKAGAAKNKKKRW